MSAHPRGPYPRAAPPSSKASPRGGTWSYDGSLEGLLVLAHRAWSESAPPEAVANALAAEGELFALLGPSPLHGAPLSPADLGRLAEAAASVLRAFSGELFDLIVRVWMSEESLELPLFRLCAEAGLHGSEVLADHGDPDLRAVSRAARRVLREIHRLTGLARFSPRADGLYAAPLEPDANVIAALMPHFARRFGEGDFALVDIRRRLAFARRGGRFESAAGGEALAFMPDAAAAGGGGEGNPGGADPADEEVLLWKRYHKAAENPARRNPELQRRLMPRRYWKYLPELEGGASGTR
jgi:probable DNA metabolism protein